MALSQQILQLLDSLTERGLDLDWAIFAAEEFPHDLTDVQREEFRQNEEAGRAISRWIAEAKLKPTRAISDEEILLLAEVVDSGLDAHFAISALGAIPRLVRRWRRLQTIRVILLPGEKVTRYLAQATTCYLYGFFEASTIVSRSLLQFALEEAFGELGGVGAIQSTPGRGDYLKNLIDLAGKTRLAPGTMILPDTLAGRAHAIRRVGNKCAHQESCSGAEALQVLRNAADILKHIYGGGRTKSG